MIKNILYIFIFISLNCLSQQTAQFTQFTFNKYGYNPAAAGTNINSGLEVVVGARKQWIGFKNAPTTNFLSANYTIKPQRSYKRWHNVGIYMGREKVGIFRTESYYLSYTLHLPLTKRINMSFGIFAGVKNIAMDRNFISTDDPVYGATYPYYFLIYPDFIPGIRVYTKKTFLDVSIQQTYKNKMAQGNKQIGTKSTLIQQLYISFGRKIALDNDIVIVPAINIHSSFINIPSIEGNLMAYYHKRIGVGVTLRNKDFISGIFQIRFFKNMTAGFAYDYSINRINSSAPHTVEIMLGLTPMMTSMGDEKGKHNVAKCPNFDF